jgi:hypothetical protein
VHSFAFSIHIAKALFHETVERYYTHLSDDILRYEELVHDNTCFLDGKMIRKLQYRLQFCAKKADDFLKKLHTQVGGSTTGKDFIKEITDQAWDLQIVTETHLDSLLQQSSVGMTYFPQTFRMIEEIDPSKLRKGASQEGRKRIV